MAKNSTTTQQQTPAPEAPEEVSFDFDSFDTEIAVPAHVPSAPRANALPFRGLFDKMEPVAKEGKTPSKFLPVSFWTSWSSSTAPARRKSRASRSRACPSG